MKLIEFANASIGNPSNDVLLQSRENETITESTNSSIDSHSLKSLMGSRESETITKSTNASIDSHSLQSLMQSRGSKTITESANASIGNPSNDSLWQSRGNETITESARASIDSHSLESLMGSRKSETITKSANASIASHSLEPRMQSHGSETITESTNASIDSHSLESIMQSSESETITITESANASIGNPSNDSLLQSRESETITESANASIVAGHEHECIICNWTFLKENINLDHIKDDLISTELIDMDDCDGREYHDKSRQRKLDHLLTCVVHNIGSPSDLEKFINIFETGNKYIADKLKLPIEVPDWSKGVKNVEKCRHRLATNRKLIEKELKKPHKLFDDFLENFVFDIDDHEELCNLTGGRKKMAECFMDKVLTSVQKGSYDLLLHILQTEMCNVHQRIVVALDKTPDQSVVPQISVCITRKSLKLYESNEDNTPRTDINEGCDFTITIKGDARCEHQLKENVMKMDTIMVREFGALLTHVTDGSVVIHLKSIDGDIISRLTDSIRRGQFVRLIEELFSCHEANSSIPSGHWSVEFIIELDNSSSKMKLPATPLKLVVKTGDHRLQLLHANKAFLREEIDPLTLLEAFSKRGLDHFKEANIEIIPERKLRTDKFLDILEKESDQLMEVFIQILEDQKMNFVLKRLKLYQKMQFIDAALLKKNIIKHIESIVDEVDLEDIKDEIISRYGLHGDVVEELYSQYPEGSEGRIVAMIVDILGQGDSAVCMFIDILFNSGIDSSLLEELSDIEQVRDDMDCVGDNAFEIIREVPERGLIFQCEVEVTVEVKDVKLLVKEWEDKMSRYKARSVDLCRLIEKQYEDKLSWIKARYVDFCLLIEKQHEDKISRDKASDVLSESVDKISRVKASDVLSEYVDKISRYKASDVLSESVDKISRDKASDVLSEYVEFWRLIEKQHEEFCRLLEKQHEDKISRDKASGVLSESVDKISRDKAFDVLSESVDNLSRHEARPDDKISRYKASDVLSEYVELWRLFNKQREDKISRYKASDVFSEYVVLWCLLNKQREDLWCLFNKQREDLWCLFNKQREEFCRLLEKQHEEFCRVLEKQHEDLCRLIEKQHEDLCRLIVKQHEDNISRYEARPDDKISRDKASDVLSESVDNMSRHEARPDEKPPFHQMSDHNTVSEPSK